MKSVKKLSNYIFIGIFILILCAPTAYLFFNMSEEITYKNFKEVLSNSFPYKDDLIESYNYIRYKAFKIVKSENVLVGKDEWLFLKDNDEDDVLGTFLGDNLFSNEEIRKIEENISSTSEKLKRIGVDFSLVIVPNKLTLYNENLPKHITLPIENRLNQIKGLDNNKIIIPSDTMLQNKDKYMMYNKTSFEWSDAGAYYAYKDIISKLNIQDLTEDNIAYSTEKGYIGELAKTLGMNKLLKENITNIALTTQKAVINENSDSKAFLSTNKIDNGESILILGDASMQKMNRFFAESFKKVTSKPDFQIDLSYIKKEKPDRVILSITENQLSVLLNNEIIKEEISSEKLVTPTVIAKTMADSNNLVLVGNATKGSTTVVTGGKEEVYEDCSDGSFIIKVPLNDGVNKLKIFSYIGNDKSEEVSITFEKDKTVASKPVVVGSDSYLFLNEDVPDFTGTNLFSNEQLNEIQLKLKEKSDFIKTINPNAKFIVFMVPNKLSFYNEMKPKDLIESENSRLKQLTDKLKNETSFDFINPTEALNKYKTEDNLYYKTDIHWNELGAFYGYKELEKKLKEYNPNTKELTIDMYEKKYVSEFGGDLAYYLGIKNNILKEREIRLIPKFTIRSNLKKDPPMTWMGNLNKQFTTSVQDSNLPKAVVFRDSFATNMMPYLSENFRSITYCEEWNFSFNKDILSKEKPDFVIYEILEKNLDELLK